MVDLSTLTTRELEVECHSRAIEAGWHHDLKTNEPKPINVGEKLMLIVSEIGEAMEGDRKNLMDDKLPHRKMIEVELADAVIRIFDTSGLLGLNVTEAILEKMAYNTVRPDHKKEARLSEGGKQY